MAEQEGVRRDREVIDRLNEIMTSGEFERLEEVLHPDFVQEIPQSGERVIGIDNFRRILENLPGARGGLSVSSSPHIVGDEEHYVMTPTFTVVKVQGAGGELTSYVKATYPDGSDWYIVTFSSFRDGRIVKRVDFFAECFAAPKWRAQWVGRM